ncbi:MAG: hypothetical protein KME23_12615 [Goleter apudmare HA4340-LM2]|nr:hypothetical protein [Goleter apudmare HA4340-LM2]
MGSLFRGWVGKLVCDRFWDLHGFVNIFPRGGWARRPQFFGEIDILSVLCPYIWVGAVPTVLSCRLYVL